MSKGLKRFRDLSILLLLLAMTTTGMAEFVSLQGPQKVFVPDFGVKLMLPKDYELKYVRFAKEDEITMFTVNSLEAPRYMTFSILDRSGTTQETAKAHFENFKRLGRGEITVAKQGYIRTVGVTGFYVDWTVKYPVKYPGKEQLMSVVCFPRGKKVLKAVISVSSSQPRGTPMTTDLKKVKEILKTLEF